MGGRREEGGGGGGDKGGVAGSGEEMKATEITEKNEKRNSHFLWKPGIRKARGN